MLTIKNKKLNSPFLGLPDDCTDLNIALRLTGGVGDVLIAIAGSAEAIKNKWPTCNITAFVMEHQIELLSCVGAIDKVETGTALNYPKTRSSFDALVDFTGCFANSREIRNEEYYTLASNKLGLAVDVPCLCFNWTPRKSEGRYVVALHPGASNPNRRWPEPNWHLLANRLVSNGLSVLFLGTWDEFSTTDLFITNASDISDSLVDQIEMLASCSYFVGNDSGFAHLAGILDIPGTVIFSATKPEHVICRYPHLRAVDCYDKLGITPSRSLRIDCERASAALDFISVDDVLETIPFSDL